MGFSCLLTDLEEHRRCADGGCGIVSQKLEGKVKSALEAYGEGFVLDTYLEGVYRGNESDLSLERVELPVRRDGRDSTRAVNHLITIYEGSDENSIKGEALLIASCMTGESMGRFARSIFEYWVYRGSKAVDKWMLLIPIIHGNNCILREIESLIHRLGVNSMQRMAVYLVKALVLRGDRESLVVLDRVRRVSKYKSLRTGAGDALAEVAMEMKLSRHEIEDILIGDMGFGRGEIMLDYGGEVMKLHLGVDFSIGIERGNGKIIKALPKRPYMSLGMMETKDRIKLLKKNIKRELKIQTLRAEGALGEFRRWRGAAFKELVLKNLVMSRMGRNLLWGRYRGDTLETPFYVEDDLYTLDGERLTIEEDSSIALVHPLELCEQEIEAWSKNFQQRGREDILGQLTREIILPVEDRSLEEGLPRSCPNRVVPRLKKRGWNTEEGTFHRIHREIPELNLRAEAGLDSNLSIERDGVEGDSIDGMVGVKSLKFYPLGKGVEEDSPYELKEISPRVVSEFILEVKKAFL